MKYIKIVVDYNDADYRYTFEKISDERLELIMPVINAVKGYKGLSQWDKQNWYDVKRNKPERKPKALYLDSGLVTKDAYESFRDILPENWEAPIHTIKSIEILEVTDIKKLL